MSWPKRTRKSNMGAGDYLSAEEIKCCRQVLTERERLIFETMIQTGLRPGEVCALQKRDVAVRYGKR
mgnify:CR=1 FL=1